MQIYVLSTNNTVTCKYKLDEILPPSDEILIWMKFPPIEYLLPPLDDIPPPVMVVTKCNRV